MTDSFANEIAAALPPALSLPPELRLTFDWMGGKGHLQSERSGRTCYLRPARAGQRDGCVFTSGADNNWLVNAAMAPRLGVLLNTGGDGSVAALWLDDQGRQRVVHLGSGTGSTLVGVFSDTALDMLRLLAIGYDELCWPEKFAAPPEPQHDERCLSPEAVAPFRAFIETTFAVTVPRTAAEIVGPMADMFDEASDDPFWRWADGHGAFDELI